MNPKIFALLLLSMAGIGTVFFLEPIPQDLTYHNFADQRVWLGIPNALNVLSNLPFLFIGIGGVLALTRRDDFARISLWWQYLAFFLGVFLTGFGSAYYHWAPSNETLIWDRLPMTIAFMSFFPAIVSELISRRVGRIIFPPLVATGILSIVYWAWSESAGAGDLRPYALVQLLPILLIGIMLAMFRPPRRYLLGIAAMIFLYLIAKLLELADVNLYELGKLLSGHTLKHLAAALSAYCLVVMLRLRIVPVEKMKKSVPAE